MFDWLKGGRIEQLMCSTGFTQQELCGIYQFSVCYSAHGMHTIGTLIFAVLNFHGLRYFAFFAFLFSRGCLSHNIILNI